MQNYSTWYLIRQFCLVINSYFLEQHMGISLSFKIVAFLGSLLLDVINAIFDAILLSFQLPRRNKNR